MKALKTGLRREFLSRDAVMKRKVRSRRRKTTLLCFHLFCVGRVRTEEGTLLSCPDTRSTPLRRLVKRREGGRMQTIWIPLTRLEKRREVQVQTIWIPLIRLQNRREVQVQTIWIPLRRLPNRREEGRMQTVWIPLIKLPNRLDGRRMQTIWIPRQPARSDPFTYLQTQRLLHSQHEPPSSI